jgi:hypothetical protein
VSAVELPLARRIVPADVAALARGEGSRLLRHPALLLGLALGVVVAVASAGSDGGEQLALLGGMGCLPLGLGVLVAAQLSTLRSRRDGTEELLSSLPRRARSRTAGHLLALGWTVPVAVALVAAGWVLVGAGQGLVLNEQGLRHVPGPAELAQGPLLVVALGSLGVLLGRVAPWPQAGALAVIILFAFEVPFAMWGTAGPASWLLPFASDALIVPGAWVPCEPGDIQPSCNLVLGVAQAAVRWHALYLAAAVVAFGGAALARSGRAAAAWGAAIVALAGAMAVAAP